MARVNLTVQSIERTGTTPSYSAATTDGHMFLNGEGVFIHIKNSDAAKTLTIQTPGTVDGMAVADRTVAVGATTGDKMVGPFTARDYNQRSGNDEGKVYIDYSAITGVSVAIFQVR